MKDKKEFTAVEVVQELAKSLHKTILKAMGDRMVADLADPNHRADVDPDEVPAEGAVAVLNKAPALPGMQQPKKPKAPKMGLKGPPAPKSPIPPSTQAVAIAGKMGKADNDEKEQYKPQQKGVHSRFGSPGKSAMGQAVRGAWSSGDEAANKAKTHREHERVMTDMSKIKPNLPKSEEGMSKKEYSVREVGVAILQKMEEMGKKKLVEWDSTVQPVKGIDPKLNEEKESFNINFAEEGGSPVRKFLKKREESRGKK